MGTITLHCDAILCQSEITLEIPGWDGEVEREASGHSLYCPDPACRLQAAWFHAQCPGCVESYPQCRLFQAYAYEYRRTITRAQIDVIRQGFCPFRTNGTLGLTPGEGLRDIDLSDPATPESGEAVAAAIKGYIARYPAPPPGRGRSAL